MSTPARAVEPTTSVRDAMTLCQRHGQSGVFVAEEGRLVGGVSREDLDKAIGHDLAHAPVRGIMSSEVVSAHEDSSLSELRTLVTAAEDGRVAVLRDRELVGVVSRADLLRALEGVPAQLVRRSSRASATSFGRVRASAKSPMRSRSWASALTASTSSAARSATSSSARRASTSTSPSRVMRSRSPTRSPGALGGRATPHQRFGTAIVSYGDGERIDVVTTRTEFYDAPGALPTVERAGLREDLLRRDFTINAMAASLGTDDFGRLVDPYGGRADLDARVLRVLHNLSFIDDPTRIFRGVRYEARHGFRFEDHTARLLRGCIEMGLVGDLSSSRLRDELVALLEEPGAAAGIRRLGELGADRAIHPHLRGDDDAAALFSRASELRDELAVDVPRWHIGLAALAREMPPDEAYDWLDRLTLRRRDAERIVGAVTVAPRIVERLRSEQLDAAQVVALADPFAPDAPLLALAIEDRPELREYFEPSSRRPPRDQRRGSHRARASRVAPDRRDPR